MMDIDNIIQKRQLLEKQLTYALATMERKTTIYNLRTQLLDLQQQCPHFSSKYNWACADGKCPYCGYKF